MRQIGLLITCSFILFSCKKENLSKNSDYRRFIGDWESTNGEKTKLEFDKKGKITILISTERGNSFKPISVSIKKSDIYQTNGVYWDHFYFYKENKAGKIESIIVNINSTNDSLYFKNKKIVGFIPDSTSYSILLVKK